jgi:hypothetical protein
MGGLVVLGTAGCLDMEPAKVTEQQVEKSGLTRKVILDWGTHTRTALVVATNNLDPLVATRTLAMVHVAMHDAINAALPVFETYAYDEVDIGANQVAAAASAAHRVLVSLFPAQSADLDAKLAASLADVTDGSAENRGVALGIDVGDTIVALRANDGSNTPIGYTPGTGPGKYQFVPPLDFVIHPEWRYVTPWTMTSPSQFRSAPPPALTSTKYAQDYNEVKAAGVKTGSNRTADQTAYAKFWEENSDIGWNRVAVDIVLRKGLHLYSSARLMALVNMAMADAFIAGWDSKLHYDFWRPYTAIRAGGTDGNGSTAADPAWEGLLFTPPVQDYPSTHSALGKAAATVIADVFGDETSFSITSSTAQNPNVDVRYYDTLSDGAAENGDSRVRGGLHFRFAVNAGLTMGEAIGQQTIDNYLRFIE